MTNGEIRYRSAPRDPCDAEAAFCREQADLYNAALKGSPFIRLIPACMFCGQTYEEDINRMTLTFDCTHCGKANAADMLRAGRLADA